VKKLISLVCLVAIMAICLPAIAEDGNNVLDQIGDTLSGKGLTYAGVEAIKDFNLKTPILFVDKIGLKFWTDFQVSEIDEGVDRDVRGGARVRLIF